VRSFDDKSDDLSSNFSKENMDEILRNSGGTVSLGFGNLSPTPFFKKNVWRNVLDYTHSKKENHYFDKHVISFFIISDSDSKLQIENRKNYL